MSHSIRSVLLAQTLVGATLVIGFTSIAIDFGIYRTLVAKLDRALATEATLLASAVKLTPEGYDHDFAELDMRDFASVGGPAFLRMESGPDSIVYESPGLGRRALPSLAGFQFDGLANGPRVRAFRKTYALRIDTEDFLETPGAGPAPHEAHLTVSLARSMGDIEETMRRSRLVFLIAGVGGGILMWLMLRLAIRASLRPLDQLAAEIALMPVANAGTRVALDRAPAEILPVAQRLNELLERTESALERERAFSADIAHELRTPLAGLRSTIEVQSMQSRSPEEYQRTLADSLAIIGRMENITRTLLYLGRLESGQVEATPVALDLTETIDTIWETLADDLRKKELRGELNLAQGVQVFTDPVLLPLLVRNVMENAVAHANERGRVQIGLTARAQHVELSVRNSGSRVSQAEVEGLFERFARADSSRAGSERHAGLGLPLVRRLAKVLRVEVRAESQPGQDFVVSLFIPLVINGR